VAVTSRCGTQSATWVKAVEASSLVLDDVEEGPPTAEEIDKLRLGGDGHIVVWGGVGLWLSLMQLDLIDELHVSMFPYVAGEGTRLFDGDLKSYALELVSSTPSPGGIVELRYRRPR
jgi:dihydrofolate reductase